MKWYWRDGSLALDRVHPDNPEWLEKMRAIDGRLADRDYKVVRQETLDNGYIVSTVWLGLDHAYGQGPPLIFETAVFGYGVMERYSTEEEAIAGHERIKAEMEEHEEA